MGKSDQTNDSVLIIDFFLYIIPTMDIIFFLFFYPYQKLKIYWKSPLLPTYIGQNGI